LADLHPPPDLDLDPDPHQDFELDTDPAPNPHQNNADPQPWAVFLFYFTRTVLQSACSILEIKRQFLIYRVAAMFSERFQCFTVALKSNLFY
jgi:hypothetical protein